MILNKTGSYLYATVGLLAAPWKLPNLERGGQSIIMQQHLFAPGPTHNFRFSPLPYKEFEVPFCPKTERVREREEETERREKIGGANQSPMAERDSASLILPGTEKPDRYYGVSVDRKFSIVLNK